MSTGETLHIVLFSFGFKYGTPVDVNYLMDMRFLPNPYWVEELKEKTGKDAGVSNYVLQSESGKATAGQLKSYVDFIISQNKMAGKKTLRIGVGCTGGRHRSVAMTEYLAHYLRGDGGDIRVFHRDIDKDGLVTDC